MKKYSAIHLSSLCVICSDKYQEFRIWRTSMLKIWRTCCKISTGTFGGILLMQYFTV